MLHILTAGCPPYVEGRTGGEPTGTPTSGGSLMSSTELDYARKLTGTAISAPDHVLDAFTVACAVTHRIDDLYTAFRWLTLGEKGSGKSTTLTVASYLAANCEPVTGVLGMTAPSYVADFRMNPRATHPIDE